MTKQLLAKGMGASPGTATGIIVFRSEDAVELASQGKAVIVVRMETTPEDVPGMRIAAGIVTTRGGITGDAAIVARSLGKPCIASCSSMHVDYAANSLTVWREGEDITLKKGEIVTIDGATGEIWMG
ncbi:MAG TPA: PEP-utilizing enzyme [Labilithrix sp.]|jgi:pyruvate,orthophosphate dikinase|nr:PEP-utilizing enzyme [Labilithrix sp.]